jgi:hypothetical protein
MPVISCRSDMRRESRLYWALSAAERGGTPQWKVPTDRARRRIALPRAAGWSIPAITAAAGVAPCTVWLVTTRRRCNNTVSDALLALQP